MSFAKAVLSGTVASEPEKRFTPNNHAVTSFNLSVEQVATGSKAGPQEPFVVKITCWRNLAEAVATQLHKGDNVLVDGKLIINSFQTQDGVQKKLFELEATTVDKLPGGAEPILVAPGAEGAAGNGHYGGNPPTMPAYEPPTVANTASGHFSSEDLLTEDDIPF